MMTVTISFFFSSLALCNTKRLSQRKMGGCVIVKASVELGWDFQKMETSWWCSQRNPRGPKSYPVSLMVRVYVGDITCYPVIWGLLNNHEIRILNNQYNG